VLRHYFLTGRLQTIGINASNHGDGHTTCQENHHSTPVFDHLYINTIEVDAMLGTRYSPLGKKLSQQQPTINHVELYTSQPI
jgi:hypothetical protein